MLIPLPPLAQPPPSVDVFECIMSVSQMVVQGMWAKGSSPILQLPHISHNQLKHFRTKKVLLLAACNSFSIVAPISPEHHSVWAAERVTRMYNY